VADVMTEPVFEIAFHLKAVRQSSRLLINAAFHKRAPLQKMDGRVFFLSLRLALKPEAEPFPRFFSGWLHLQTWPTSLQASLLR
jgi:hypothetical protein